LLIDRPDEDVQLEDGVRFLWYLAGIFFTGAFFTMIRGYLFSLAGERVVRRVRTQLFAAIIRQDVAFFDIHRTGDLTNRLSVDTMMIQQAATLTVGFMMRFLIQIVGGTIMLLTLSWKLTFYMLMPMPVLLGLGLMYGRVARKLQQRVQTGAEFDR
jgi:ABC-type multidrug transport system fused ATPase/permease subunit